MPARSYRPSRGRLIPTATHGSNRGRMQGWIWERYLWKVREVWHRAQRVDDELHPMHDAGLDDSLLADNLQYNKR